MGVALEQGLAERSLCGNCIDDQTTEMLLKPTWPPSISRFPLKQNHVTINSREIS